MFKGNWLTASLKIMVVVSGLIPATTAFADARNRNLLPLGYREALLGNAGVALTESPGSVYYNPGALARLSKSHVSLFGSTYFYTESNVDRSARVDNTDIPFRSFGNDARPSSIISTFKMGEFTGALSLLIPGSLRTFNTQSWETPNTRVSLAQTTDNQELMMGLSLARNLSASCGLGGTAFFLRNSGLMQRFTRISFPAAPNIPIMTMFSLHSEVYNFATTLGLLCRVPNSTTDIGLRVQSPSIRLSGKADIFYSYDSVVPATHTEVRDSNYSAQYELPVDVSFGVGVRPSEMIRVYLDMSVQGSSDYDLLPGNQFNSKISAQSAMRYNVGAEIFLSSSTVATLGGTYNPSSNQVVERDGEQKDDYYGTTFGLNSASNEMNIGGGIFYLWSTGQRVVGNSYEKTPVENKILGAMLMTSYAF